LRTPLKFPLKREVIKTAQVATLGSNSRTALRGQHTTVCCPNTME